MTSPGTQVEAPSHHRALEIYRRTGDQLGVAAVLQRMAFEAHSAEEMFNLTAQSRRIHRDQADLHGLATMFARHAHDLALVRGDYPRALEVNEKSLHLYWTLTERAQSVASIRNAAHIQLQLGETGKAFDLLDDAVGVTRSLLPRTRFDSASLLELQGALQHDGGDLEGALTSFREAERLVEDGVEDWAEDGARSSAQSSAGFGWRLGLRLAWLLLELGRTEEACAYARTLADQPLSPRYDCRERQIVACCVLADAATAEGRPRTAAHWLRRGLEPAARFPLLPAMQTLLIGASRMLLTLGETDRASALLSGVAANPASSWSSKRQAVSLIDRCIDRCIDHCGPLHGDGPRSAPPSGLALAPTGNLLAWLAAIEAGAG